MASDQPVDSWEPLLGKRVKIYYNLHKRCLSVLHRGRVVAHLPHVSLGDVQFIVQPAGRERVRREQRKNVHAFVVGTVIPFVGTPGTSTVTYNPYQNDTFVEQSTGLSVHHTETCTLIGKGVFIR